MHALKTRSTEDGIPISRLIARFCRQGLALTPGDPPDFAPDSPWEERLRRLEIQVQVLQQQLAAIPNPGTHSHSQPKSEATAAPPPSSQPAEDQPRETQQWDPVTHDFDSWLLMTWQRYAIDLETGDVRWGSPVKADQIHEAGFKILRKQAFLDRLATSEAPGLHATSWDPDHPELAQITCRIQTVIFYDPSQPQPD
ncbi:MAG: hypothetical protein OHK0012_08850 [Synechococcales cyanobacterium]